MSHGVQPRLHAGCLSVAWAAGAKLEFHVTVRKSRNDELDLPVSSRRLKNIEQMSLLLLSFEMYFIRI